MTHIGVYTDGSCLNNGTPKAKAGVGVFFGINNPRNISRGMEGKQTNNTAEVSAILAAIAELTPELESGSEVTIHTDSTYAIRVCGEYGDNMSKRGWKTVKDELIPNADLVQSAWQICARWPNLKFAHVYGHTGDDDPHSLGNAWADKLAVQGAGGRYRIMRPPPEAPPRRRTGSSKGGMSVTARGASGGGGGGGGGKGEVWLTVSFAQKDQAKALGARWNPHVKNWYVPEYVNGQPRSELVRRWGPKAGGAQA